MAAAAAGIVGAIAVGAAAAGTAVAANAAAVGADTAAAAAVAVLGAVTAAETGGGRVGRWGTVGPRHGFHRRGSRCRETAAEGSCAQAGAVVDNSGEAGRCRWGRAWWQGVESFPQSIRMG